MQAAVRNRYILLTLVVASLALKAAYANFKPNNDDTKLALDIANVFKQRRFQVDINPRVNKTPIVTASRGKCVIKARDSSFTSGYESNNQTMFGSVGEVRLAYAGSYFPNERIKWVDTKLRLERELARLGWPVLATPVITIAANPACRPPAKWFSSLKLQIG